jgi:hypothetical protein
VNEACEEHSIKPKDIWDIDKWDFIIVVIKKKWVSKLDST